MLALAITVAAVLERGAVMFAMHFSYFEHTRGMSQQQRLLSAARQACSSAATQCAWLARWTSSDCSACDCDCGPVVAVGQQRSNVGLHGTLDLLASAT